MKWATTKNQTVIAPSHPPHGGCGLKLEDKIAKAEDDSGHPPHGGCGLKYLTVEKTIDELVSPSTRRVWIEIKKSSKIFEKSLGHPPHGGCGLK